MNEKEKRIREQRTIEATRKNLMGFSGKLGVILRVMGQPIISQEEGLSSDLMGYHSTEWRNPWDEEDKEEIPTMEVLDAAGQPVSEPEGYAWDSKRSSRQNTSVRKIGWHFDGLSRSIHLEIKYLEERSEIFVHWEGKLVFQETAGELQAYVPSQDWEDKIEHLFKIARKADEDNRKKEKQERIEEAQKKKATWIENMKTFWGL